MVIGYSELQSFISSSVNLTASRITVTQKQGRKGLERSIRDLKEKRMDETGTKTKVPKGLFENQKILEGGKAHVQRKKEL